ncbi:hypothetical protein ACNSOL_12365 (plasmid) [Aliarcobacter lanthieri]|uniref:hypothetical protein n=1 Tax=Aliarcobacter lanthieri TaxID=1355374 RepID=UPI003AAC37F9
MTTNKYLDLLDFAGIDTKEDEKRNSQLTVLSFGGGQDSTTILLKLIFDKHFRIKYAPNNLLVLFADTGNEHPFTYEYIERVIEPLCIKHNIEFVKITNDMGFHSRTWKTLTYQWKLNTPTIGSMAYPKSCTHNLKLNPQYNYLGDKLSKLFKIPKGNKKEYEYYAKQNGRIRFLIGIAKNEEKRVNGYWYINFNYKKIKGKIKTIKGIEYFISDEQYYEISYISSNKYINIQNKKIEINFQYDVVYDAFWKEKALITEYPLIDIGYDRTACQEYINSLGIEIPYPSNCMFCPFSSGSHMEILWLYMNMPERFYEWVELEEKKLEYFKNNHNIILNKLNKPTNEQKITLKIDFLNETSLNYLSQQLLIARNTNTQITINCLNYLENKAVEDFIQKNSDVVKMRIPNLGANARIHKDGPKKGVAFSLLDMLEEAQYKYEKVTLEEIQRYKFSHGNCIESKY